MTQSPKPFRELISGLSNPTRIAEIMNLRKTPRISQYYPHWDRLRRYPPPTGFTSEEWWLAAKIQRMSALKSIPLLDKSKREFQYCVPEFILEHLHGIDTRAGSMIGTLEPITNPQTRDRYLIRSLMEEAITSSQLEGAATTREVAKEMIRTGRQPADKEEQMIFNNFVTMQRITDLKNYAMSPEMVF